MPSQAADPPVRDRSAAPPTLQKADMLSPIEIRAAAKIAQRENGALSGDEMVIVITRILGFKRAGADLKAVIEKCAERSVSQERGSSISSHRGQGAAQAS
jgi:hypothetical protein